VCVYLIIFTAVGEPHRVYKTNDLGRLQVEKFSECSAKSPDIGIGLYVLECGVMVYAWFLCWMTKNVPDALNEAKHIALGRSARVHIPLHSTSEGGPSLSHISVILTVYVC